MTLTTADSRTQLAEQGFVVVEDVFDADADFDAIYGEWEEILDGIARALVAEGSIDATHAGMPFPERLLALCAETGRSFHQPFDISLPQKDIEPEHRSTSDRRSSGCSRTSGCSTPSRTSSGPNWSATLSSTSA